MQVVGRSTEREGDILRRVVGPGITGTGGGLLRFILRTLGIVYKAVGVLAFIIISHTEWDEATPARVGG